MRHQVNIFDLKEFKENEKMLFASSSSDQKKIYVTLYGVYEVHSKGKVVLTTDFSAIAVEKYNSL